jgi:hypothetical protein
MNTFIKVIFLLILLNSTNAQTFDTIIVKMYKSDTSNQPYDTFFYVRKRKTNKSIYKRKKILFPKLFKRREKNQRK